MTDGNRFDCRFCQAAPHLQERLGCFEATEEPVFEAAGNLYNRCPITYQSHQAVRLLAMFGEGALDASYEHKRLWPPKQIAALFHIKYLYELKEAERGN